MSLPPLPELPLGRYRHYKGNEYRVLGVTRHSETLEILVVYQQLYGDQGWWVRPYGLFVSTVEIDGSSQPRFTWIAPA
jgi:hypothetical protein